MKSQLEFFHVPLVNTFKAVFGQLDCLHPRVITVIFPDEEKDLHYFFELQVGNIKAISLKQGEKKGLALENLIDTCKDGIKVSLAREKLHESLDSHPGFVVNGLIYNTIK